MSIYKKGARKEYHLCESLRKKGYDIVFRSAGSHSSIDIVAIDTISRVILLIQSKRTLDKNMNYIDPKIRERLLNDNSHIAGVYDVIFDVM